MHTGTHDPAPQRDRMDTTGTAHLIAYTTGTYPNILDRMSAGSRAISSDGDWWAV
jgi:hypothetical protein